MDADAKVLETMLKDGLQEELRKAEEALDDVREERRFTLAQTGVHLGAHKLKVLHRNWSREEASLRERIGLIKSLLER